MQDHELKQFCENVGLQLSDSEKSCLEGSMANSLVYSRIKNNTKHIKYAEYVKYAKEICEIISFFNFEKIVEEDFDKLEEKLSRDDTYDKKCDKSIKFSSVQEVGFFSYFARILCGRQQKELQLKNKRYVFATLNERGAYPLIVSSTEIIIQAHFSNYSPDNDKNYIEFAIDNNIPIPEIEQYEKTISEFESVMSEVKFDETFLEHLKDEKVKEDLRNQGYSENFYTKRIAIPKNDATQKTLTKYAKKYSKKNIRPHNGKVLKTEELLPNYGTVTLSIGIYIYDLYLAYSFHNNF